VGTGYDQIVKFAARIPPQTPASLTQGVYTDTVIISLRY
jgi:spore coat protein U-like protein